MLVEAKWFLLERPRSRQRADSNQTVAEKPFQVYKYYYAPSELEELIKTAFGKVEQILTTTYEQICVAH